MKKQSKLLIAVAGLAAGTMSAVMWVIFGVRATKFVNDVKDLGVTLDGTPAYSAIGVAIFLLAAFFFIFGVFYAVSKKPKTQGRKWPYITTIVTGLIAVILFVIRLTSGNKDTGLVDLEGTTYVQKGIELWNDAKGVIHTTLIVGMIFALVAVVLAIVQLVLIKKSKNQTDVIYSEQVRNFQPKNNDLP